MKVFKWIGEIHPNYWEYYIKYENKNISIGYDGKIDTNPFNYPNRDLKECSCLIELSEKEVENLKVSLL